MPRPRRRRRGAEGPKRSRSRIVIATLAACLALTGIAAAATVGLSNGSFEDGLSGWTTSVLADGATTPGPASCATPEGICVVEGNDEFTVQDEAYNEQAVSVAPIDGTKMVRIGGPFLDSDTNQSEDRYRVEQTFTVDPENPRFAVNYNIYTWDYTGFDDVTFRVTLIDENGEVLSERQRGAFGSGTSLKTTGWQAADVDLTGYEGQQVHLRIEAGGTSDDLYGFWVYLDGGELPPRAVGTPEATVPQLPGGGNVNLNVQEVDGQTFFNVPNSQVSQFDGGCMPLTLTFPINVGGSTLSDPKLLLDGTAYTVTPTATPGMFTATIPCVESGQLILNYKLTEEGVTQEFSVPIGGITLIDPQGVVYDARTFAEQKAAGKSDAEARSAAAIQGATVRLQRLTGDTWVNVLSGDPGISPNVNPQTTGTDGLYQWDVEEGTYRVVVRKAGYGDVTSQSVNIPPPVLDLHIAMSPAGWNPNAGTNNNNAGNDAVVVPQQQGQSQNLPQQKKPACAGLTAKKRAACQREQRLAKQLATCNKLKAKGKRALCAKRARALSKCETKKGKKKKACVRKAKAIGAKKK